MTEAKTNNKSHQNNNSKNGKKSKPKSLKTNTAEGTIKLFGKKCVKGVGVTKLKSKLRSITRFIQSFESGKVPMDKEKLAKLKEEQKDVETKIAEANKMNTNLARNVRFTKVKMIEKMKLKRKIEQLKKQLANMLVDVDEAPEEEEVSLRNALADREEDLIYVRNFPPEEVYISIIKPATGDALAKRTSIRDCLLAEVGYARPTYRMSAEWDGEGANEQDADAVQSRKLMVQGDDESDADDFFADDNEESGDDENNDDDDE